MPTTTKIKPARMPPVNRKCDEAMVALAQFALARRFTKGQVKKLIQEEWANQQHVKVSARTCEKAISLARAELLQLTGKKPNDLRNESYVFYDSVLRDSSATVRERLLAQERIDKLFSLEGPIAIDVRNAADTNAAVRELSKTPQGAELLEKLDDALAAQRAAEAKGSNP